MVSWIYETLAKVGYVHPLHPIIGHLPLGLIIGAFILQFYAVVLKRPTLFPTVQHCLTLALIAWLPTVLLGYADWQYRFQSQWLHPIIMKMILSGILLVFLSIIVVRRVTNPLTPGAILIICTLCLLTVTGIGFYGAELIYKNEIPRQSEQELRRKGASLYTQHCSSCHLIDSTERKIGVGLKGLMKRRNLPVSNRPATEENIRRLLKIGFDGMPSFADLKENEVDALVSFLKTL